MSLRKAINEKCKECIYDRQDVGGWRQQVTACTSFSCPLYDVRPVSGMQTHPDQVLHLPVEQMDRPSVCH